MRGGAPGATEGVPGEIVPPHAPAPCPAAALAVHNTGGRRGRGRWGPGAQHARGAAESLVAHGDVASPPHREGLPAPLGQARSGAVVRVPLGRAVGPFMEWVLL